MKRLRRVLDHHRRAVLASGVILVVILFFIYGWVNAGQDGWKWQGWAGIGAVSTFLAVALALFLAVAGNSITNWGLAPQLSLTLDPEPYHFQKFVLAEGAGLVEYDVRNSVANHGTVAAKEVQLDAAKLDVEQPDETFARDPTFMAMNLLVTHLGTLALPVVDPGIPRSFDLLQCDSRRKELIRIRNIMDAQLVDPGDGKPPTYPSRKGQGTYRLTLAIGADGIEVQTRVVEFEWSGEWSDDRDDFFKNQLKVTLLDE
jgi:hypothetical protein